MVQDLHKQLECKGQILYSRLDLLLVSKNASIKNDQTKKEKSLEVQVWVESHTEESEPGIGVQVATVALQTTSILLVNKNASIKKIKYHIKQDKKSLVVQVGLTHTENLSKNSSIALARWK